MYKENDMILYGSQGVCRIVGMTSREFGGNMIDYYILKPVYSEGSTVFVPVNNEELTSKMKKILSLDEVKALIQTMPEMELIWIDNDNRRKEKYKEIIKNGNRNELISLIKTLYKHRESLVENGKKFHATDEKFLQDAEKILYDEFKYVLNIKEEEVVPFIIEQIEMVS
ncbi:CarD family transcriptional regulator [Candidatus Stoquefichus sp. SB1]|jgi:CarD family transcriptional regulator|uniref:CarD family transcriptional regulator n=1 Tax=Candidatus Stoquefichus sp. SB1 TaxID=1658109 RepID=UPI00067E9EE7|nr:CarD family transcriptional regulator [Candidatus Stoquefichus sp. SB1]